MKKLPSYALNRTINRITYSWIHKYDFNKVFNHYFESEYFYGDLKEGKFELDTFKNLKDKFNHKVANQGNTCFGSLNYYLKNFIDIQSNKCPDYLIYDISWDSKIPSKTIKSFLTAMNKERMFGDRINIKKVMKYKVGYIKDPAKYNHNQLYFIMCNFRYLREKTGLVNLIAYLYDTYGFLPSLSLSCAVHYSTYGGYNHNYLTNGLFDTTIQKETLNQQLLKGAWKISNFLKLHNKYPIKEGWDKTERYLYCSRTLNNLIAPKEDLPDIISERTGE